MKHLQFDIAGKKVLVMGLGLQGGGVEVVKWLVKNRAIVTVTDLNSKKILAPALHQLQGLPVRFILGRHRVTDFQKTDLVIKNPAVADNSPYLQAAQKAGRPIQTDIALFFWQCPKPIIGVTGTRGKTTTTTLLGQIFKQAGRRSAVGGNVGKSPLAFLPSANKFEEIILELSSWQLQGLAKQKLSPHVAVLTNIYADHLDRHKTLANYQAAKEVIFNFQSPGDIAVVNRDNPTTKKIGAKVSAQRFWFSTKKFPQENGCFVAGGQIIYRYNGQEKKILKITDIILPGQHNLANVLAAVTTALAYGLPVTAIRQAVKNFAGVPGRLELVKQKNNIAYYNDTAATTPEATAAGLAALALGNETVILIVGGADKKLDYKTLLGPIIKYCAKVLLLPGSASLKLEKLLQQKNYRQLIKVADVQAAVRQTRIIAQPGQVVLFSPAATSFAQFVNSRQRGAAFKMAVKKYLS